MKKVMDYGIKELEQDIANIFACVLCLWVILLIGMWGMHLGYIK